MKTLTYVTLATSIAFLVASIVLAMNKVIAPALLALSIGLILLATAMRLTKCRSEYSKQ